MCSGLPHSVFRHMKMNSKCFSLFSSSHSFDAYSMLDVLCAYKFRAVMNSKWSEIKEKSAELSGMYVRNIFIHIGTSHAFAVCFYGLSVGVWRGFFRAFQQFLVSFNVFECVQFDLQRPKSLSLSPSLAPSVLTMYVQQNGFKTALDTRAFHTHCFPMCLFHRFLLRVCVCVFCFCFNSFYTESRWWCRAPIACARSNRCCCFDSYKYYFYKRYLWVQFNSISSLNILFVKS